MTESNFGPDYSLAGEKLEVLTYPNPILKKVAEPISDFSSELCSIAKNMLFTMYQAPGIGLAAPQVGLSIRMFCIDTNFSRERITAADGSENYKYSDFNPIVVINPEILESHGESIHQEGCLSFPGIFEDIKRADSILLKYQTLTGEVAQIEASGMEAICMQHELDHLEGIVFIERLSQLKRTLLLKKMNKKKKNRSF